MDINFYFKHFPYELTSLVIERLASMITNDMCYM